MGSFPQECGIGVQISPQVSGDETGLKMRQKSDSDLFIEEWMDELILFPLLPSS